LSIFCGGGTGRLPARQTVAAGGGSNGTVRKTNDGRNSTARKADLDRNGTVRKADDGRNCTSESKPDEVQVAAVDGSSSERFRMLSTTIRLQTATWEPTSVEEANQTNIERGTVDPGKQAAAEKTWTPLEATALKYDELVTRLVWIFAMTLVAIAMVFVIMFVVFFNCYGASKPENANTVAARNLWPQQSTDKVRGTMANSRTSNTPIYTNSTSLLSSPCRTAAMIIHIVSVIIY